MGSSCAGRRCGKSALPVVGRRPWPASTSYGRTLVVTDRLMLQMDGLQLAEAIQQRFPQIPVILITSQGSERTAVEALQGRAASYVPKVQLDPTLLQTIRTVADLASRRRERSRVLRCICRHYSRFVLANELAPARPRIRDLQQQVVDRGLGDEADEPEWASPCKRPQQRPLQWRPGCKFPHTGNGRGGVQSADSPTIARGPVCETPDLFFCRNLSPGGRLRHRRRRTRF